MKKIKTPFSYTSFLKSCLRANSAPNIIGMAAAGAGIAALAPQIQAQTVIIQDNFTSGSHYGTALSQQTGNSTGLAPDTTNLPGGNWQHIKGTPIQTHFFIKI